MIYYFYSNSDKDKEPIFKGDFVNKNLAILFFAAMKQLSSLEFLKLYSVSN
jgi:hypothetical protein